MYEGMYGFVSKHQVNWIDFKESNVSSHQKLHIFWQNLITTEIGEYSKEKSLNYFKGIEKDSQVLIDTSSIAWDYLQSFFDEDHYEERWFDDVKTLLMIIIVSWKKEVCILIMNQKVKITN